MPRSKLVAILAATLALIAVTALYAYSIRGDDEVSLKGIDMGELDLGGGKLLDPPNDSPVIASEQAVAIVLNANRAHGRQRTRDLAVQETKLARFVNDAAEPPIDTLAWAVSLNAGTVPAVTPAAADPCFGCFMLDPTPTPEPTPLNCGPRTVYDVVIIDARAGEWLYETKSTELVEPAAGETCPPTPTPNVASPAAPPSP